MNECDALESNKTTAGCWFTRNLPAVTTSPEGDLFYSGVVNMTLACIWITLPLVVILLGIWAIPHPMVRLVIVSAGHIAWWNTRASMPYGAFG
jgi:hypothetical protein